MEQTFGMSYTVGTRKTIEELERLARIDNADPRFVFAHVMAPHPPFYFDEDCGLTVSSRRAGLSFSRKGVPDSERAGYLRDQVECVDSLLVDFASQVPRDDIIVFTSDHGTDRRHQLVTPAEEWDEDDIAERMNAFVAAKLPEGCEVGTSLVLPNLMRRVLACISSDPIPDVEYRIHLGEGVVLSDAETNRLLQMGVAELELAGS